jgi:hypothetical protein
MFFFRYKSARTDTTVSTENTVVPIISRIRLFFSLRVTALLIYYISMVIIVVLAYYMS